MKEGSIKDKLKQNPPEGSVKKNDDGVEYIPVDIVMNLLDSLFSSWSIRDFEFDIKKVDSKYYAVCSLTLNVAETHEMSSRALVGSATFQVSSQDHNQNFSATATSLAICNAAKKLGNYFGRNLNNESDVLKKEKPKADIILLQKLRVAQDNFDSKVVLELMKNYDFSDFTQTDK